MMLSLSPGWPGGLSIGRVQGRVCSEQTAACKAWTACQPSHWQWVLTRAGKPPVLWAASFHMPRGTEKLQKDKLENKSYEACVIRAKRFDPEYVRMVSLR